MAEKDEEKLGELCHVEICCVENGYKISCHYEAEQSLSSRAGWVPPMPGECKTYVEKTREAVVKRIKELL